MRKIMVLMCGMLFSFSGFADADWISKSNAHAQVLINVMAKYSPEQAGRLGVDGLDEEILDLKPRRYERYIADLEQAIVEYESHIQRESGSKVQQDLQILLNSAKSRMRTTQLERENMLPYYNLSKDIFQGIRSIIDPQNDKKRYPAALVRLKKYAGLVEGYQPITELAMEQSRERFSVKGMIGPYRVEVEQDLERSEKFISGIRDLFEGTDLKNWKEPYEKMTRQLYDYNDWVRGNILPRARDEFRLPAVMYEDALYNRGVNADPEELIRIASQGYMDIKNEMKALAPLIAKKKRYDTSDYRVVINKLKEEQISGTELVDYYKDRLRDIEAFIVNERLITLPERDAGIRIATAAETAAQPAPHLDVPRLIGNTGEYPEFVIPLLEKDRSGNWVDGDFTFPAGTWTLTAHEARPGHELQFSSMIENGISLTRSIFAFNSANAEGWGLYAEAIVKPYMPLEGQIISLQHRLLRAARMFLDPMLNLGYITPEQAKQMLVEDVLIGEKWAQNEIERYTYRMPGQATAYYYGYTHLQGLRTEVELALQDRFDQQAFHNFILAQGLLPPSILRETVKEEFIPTHM